ELLNKAQIKKQIIDKIFFQEKPVANANSSFLKLLRLYELKKGRRSLIQLIKNNLRVTEYSSQIYNLIAKLPIKHIITINYDELLEEALKNERKKIHVIYKGYNLPYTSEKNNKTILYKIYGTLSDEDSLVITEDDILNFYSNFNKTMICSTVKYHFATKTILFIGFDLKDLTIKLLYNEITNELSDHKRQNYAIQLNPSDESILYWKGKGIKIINTNIIKFLQKLVINLEDGTGIQDKKKRKKEVIHKHPYKFLDFYDKRDSNLFFGREKDSINLIQRILAHKTIILFGKSGVGKTSIIKAGIMPKLEKQNYLPIYTRVEEDPLMSIKKSIYETAPLDNKDRFNISDSLHDFIKNNSTIRNKTLIIFLDQFEEFFIKLSLDTRVKFCKEVSKCLSNDCLDIKFVFSLREVFLYHLEEMTEYLPRIYDNRYRLKEFNKEQAKEAIIEPAKLVGVTFESECVKNIIKDLFFKGIEPIHIQIVCYHLYNQLNKNQKVIFLKDYEKSGRAKNILSKYVDYILLRFNKKDQEIAKKILKLMVTSLKTKIFLSENDILQMINTNSKDCIKILNELINLHLIRRLKINDEINYELAHEYLTEKIEEWISFEEFNAKSVKDLINLELNNWKNFNKLINKQNLEIINQQRRNPYFKLTTSELSLIIRSSIQTNYEPIYWLNKSERFGLCKWNFIEEALNSNESLARINAIKILCAIKSKKAIDSIIRIAKITDRIRIKEEAIESLGKLKASKSVITLIKCLKSKYLSIQDKALKALKKIGTKKALQAINRFHPKNMIYIPAGEFVRGSDENQLEKPRQKIFLESFYIDKFPVTNYEYSLFLKATDNKPPNNWKNRKIPKGKEDHPVVLVNWEDANKYAKWAGKRLPTELEWEKAARGTDGRKYPWGNSFSKNICNTKESNIEDTTPVNYYINKGESPYGACDMAGNVWEWTASEFKPYPGSNFHYRQFEEEYKVLRGGSWDDEKDSARCATRDGAHIGYTSDHEGFRCAMSDFKE
ncbi:MAG: SUMF1/EgtB/PvdO family nonheme iron enzyme, partial [Candidatus Heimdallarchaeota archaeon]|nr:SUMF1/EgtB/PvdO family nonheme iron enzyme [Candidatus Heimdallarchaeota archaeon]